MFERFTNQSRRAVVVAQEEARGFGHGSIGTEHILLGLVREGAGSAARVLASMDVTLDAVRREVEATVGWGDTERSSGPIPFTPRAKKSLERSLRESLQLGSGYIGTGHLLLGLISEDEDVAVQILGTLGADLDTLRGRVTQDIREHPEQQQEAGVFGMGGALRRATLIQRQPAEIRNLLEAIDARLSAIEQHLGIARDEPASPAAEGGVAARGGAAAGAEPGRSAQAGGSTEASGSAQASDDPGEPPVAAG